MKRLLSLMITLCLCLFIVSCGDDDDNGGGSGSAITLNINGEDVKMYVDDPVYSTDMKHLLFELYNGNDLYDSDIFIIYNGSFSLDSDSKDFGDASILFIGDKQYAKKSGSAKMTKNDELNKIIEFTYDCIFFNTNSKSETVTVKGDVRLKYTIE